MRKALGVALLAATILIPGTAHANHAPKAYCSESGDVCQEVRKTPDDYRLRLALGGKYFDRFKLCVKAPDDSRTCDTFRVKKMSGGIFGRNVSWSAHFPNEGAGAYTVIWRQGGNRLGHRLGFHIH
ncbi:MAG TPA: hypothetical protein VFK89_07325 [Actinomycetota bacterium]|nr:hypothetical protein [Actinomycetota bacterium]